MRGPALLERDSERGALRRAVEDPGRVLVLEGPAGIGKTALLSEVRAAAAETGATLLWARASELDRGFAFGVVHQLLEPTLSAADTDRRERLFAGAAARCRGLFDSVEAPGGEAEYAVLSGLYWVLANLAEEAPVVVVVDDLHWADLSSARFLEFLGRRIEDLPVTVVATTRPDEPGAPQALIDELAAGPATERLRPRPLGAGAIESLLTASLSATPDPEFARAAIDATGGNPLLVTTLSNEAESLQLGGRADEADRLESLVARGVAPAVSRRLRTLGSDAVDAAAAIAVMGERVSTDDVAELAGLDSRAAATAVDHLAKAGVLEQRSHAFTHPLVRAAVTQSMDVEARQRLHRAAAERLRARGARPAEVAVHRLESGPVGDAAAVEDLTGAASVAAAEGATESAVHLLRRALEEPPPLEARAHLLLQLGELEVQAQLPEGVERLREGISAGLSGDDLARARAALSTFLVHTDPAAAVDEVEAAYAEAENHDLRLRLEAFTIESLSFPDAFAERRDQYFAGGLADPDASTVMLSHLAYQRVAEGAPRDEVATLCARATAGGELMRVIGPGSSTWNLLIQAHRFNEDPDRAQALLREGDAAIRDRGLRAAGFFVEQAWGYWHRDYGSVATGAARAATGLELIREVGLPFTTPALSAVLAENLIELGRLGEAAELVDADLPEVALNSFMEPFALTVRGTLRALLRRDDEAEADLRRVVECCDSRRWRAPGIARGRWRLAELLARRGAREEARALAGHDVAVAEAAGTPGALGISLRVRAMAEEEGQAVSTLEEAVRLLETTALRRDLGWALHDLGARIRRSGSRHEAREPLRRALDLATRVEGARLAEAARGELEATGARAGRELLSGVDSLTPAERRVADLAAEGLTNREIAESLWLSAKTVEVHLSRTYGKLAIRSRRSLAGVLGGAAPQNA